MKPLNHARSRSLLHHIAVATVTHPGTKDFHGRLAESLRNQTDCDFLLLVLDDGSGEREDFFSAELTVQVRQATSGQSPAAIRRELILWASEYADAIVFIDADDWCCSERIAICRERLQEHDAIAHDMMLVDSAGIPLGPFIGPQVPNGRVNLTDIADRNFLGLSNTAAKTSVLLHAAKNIPDHIVAFDWALYTAVLADGGDVAYDTRILSGYRQYDGNIAAVTQRDSRTVCRAVRVKAEHYALFCEISPWYADRARVFGELSRRLETDGSFLEGYMSKVRELPVRSALFWGLAIADEGVEQ